MESKKIKLANLNAIPQGKGIVASYHDDDGEMKEVALFRIDDKVYALNNLCPHMQGPLGEGEVEEGVVTCPWHGWQFEVRTGECLNMPGCDAGKLPICVEGDIVYLIPSTNA